MNQAKLLKPLGDLEVGTLLNVQSLGQITGQGYVFPKRLVAQGFFEIVEEQNNAGPNTQL